MTADHRDDAELFRSLLIEDAKSRSGEHPDLDTLVDYLTDSLGAKAEDGVRDHLAACRPCTTALLDVEPLVTPEAATPGVADLQLESAWKDFASRLPRAADYRARTAPIWSGVLAASLVLAVVGLSIWVGRLRSSEIALERQLAQLSEPQANLPIFYLDGLTRGIGAEQTEIEVPAEANFLVLIFASGEILPDRFYQVRFLDPSGSEVFRSDDLQLSESGGLRLGLSKQMLPEGEYRIQVRTTSDGDERVIEEYRRTISYPLGP